MKIALIILLLFVSNCFADEFKVPFSCYPKELQDKFAQTGRKLDLSGNDRTKDSWGFIDNKGSEFTIYTYQNSTEDDLNVIKKIVMEN